MTAEFTGGDRGGLDVRAVRDFWNGLPLSVGESSHPAGERAFFEEHLNSARHEHGGRFPDIFFADIAPARVTACNLSDSGVRLTRRRVALFGLDAHVAQGSAEQLPFGTGSFDHVNCQGFSRHTPDTQACTDEFHRILQPNGTLSFSVYYSVWLLRSLFTRARMVGKAFIGFRGRGRETMFSVPADLVRYYDGAESPIGKSYARRELMAMPAGLFTVVDHEGYPIPRRALPLSMPDIVFRVLARRFRRSSCAAERSDTWRRHYEDSGHRRRRFHWDARRQSSAGSRARGVGHRQPERLL